MRQARGVREAMVLEAEAVRAAALAEAATAAQAEKEAPVIASLFFIIEKAKT